MSVTFPLRTTWWKAPARRWFRLWDWRGCSTQGSEDQWKIRSAQGTRLWWCRKGDYPPGRHHLSLPSQYREWVPRASSGDRAGQIGMGECKWGIGNVLIGTVTRYCENSKWLLMIWYLPHSLLFIRSRPVDHKLVAKPKKKQSYSLKLCMVLRVAVARRQFRPIESLQRNWNERRVLFTRSVYFTRPILLLTKLCKNLPLDGDSPRKGMYYHPIIQKAVNAMWFQNKRDEGVVFTEMFKPIPVPAIAFVLTAVCCINCLMVQLLTLNS